MISLFRKKEVPPIRKNFLKVDIHSHLLPGLDDGCQDIEETITSIKLFQQKGYEKLIITPHVIAGYYENTPQIILNKLEEVKLVLEERNIKIKLAAAAEYYVDEEFIELIKNKSKLITFGDNYVLIEFGFYNEPINLNSTISRLQDNGYRPIIAHPERYLYLYNQFEKIKQWIESGVLLQINLLSLLGYYSTPAQQFCEKIIEEGFVSFVGSDAHNPKQIELLSNIYTSKYFQKLEESNLLNNSLL